MGELTVTSSAWGNPLRDWVNSCDPPPIPQKEALGRTHALEADPSQERSLAHTSAQALPALAQEAEQRKEEQVSTLTFDEVRTPAEKLYDAEVKERVLRGMELLRRKHGENWVDMINCETLKLSSESRCVLGQIYGDYVPGREDLGLSQKEAALHGFDLFHDDSDGDTWESLEAAWRDEIC